MTVPLFESEALESAIARLKTEQKTMKEKRKQIHKDLKNAEKRRSHLKNEPASLAMLIWWQYCRCELRHLATTQTVAPVLRHQHHL